MSIDSITIKSTDITRLLFLTDEEKEDGIYLDYGNGKEEYKDCYSNGQLCEHYFFENGELHGECKEWHSNGQLRVHCLYENGKLIKNYLEEEVI